LFIDVAYDRVKHLPAVKRIQDELWNEIRMILPPETPINTIGRPVVSFRGYWKVFYMY
jgi:2-iminoacetate synthase ThiH